MYWLVLIILSLIMAFLLKTLFKEKYVSENYLIWLVVAFVGAWLGDVVLGDWWWIIADFNVIAGIIGSLVIGWIYTLIFAQIGQSGDVSA